MANEESQSSSSQTGGESDNRPVSPVNQDTTRTDSSTDRPASPPAAPINQTLTLGLTDLPIKATSGGSGTDKPTPPPNTDTTKGGGK